MVLVSKQKSKKKKEKFFFLLFLIGKIRHGIGKKGGDFFIGTVAEIRTLEMGRKSPAFTSVYFINVGIIAMDDGICTYITHQAYA